MSPTRCYLAIPQFARVCAILIYMASSASCAQVLDYRTEVTLDSRQHVTERSFLLQVNTRDHDWMAEVSIPFKEGDKFELLDAAILDKAGNTIRAVGKKEITTRHDISEGAFFEDDWVKEFSLKWNVYPYRVKYRYRITTERYIYAAFWFPTWFTNVPTTKASLKINYPADLPVRVFATDKIEGDSILIKGRVIREWKYSEIAALKREVLAPPIRSRLPCIVIAPTRFYYGLEGSLASWASYGEWQSRLNAGSTSDLPLYEQQVVAQAKAKAANQIELIKGLYHYVQDNTRYINVSMDVGGLKSYTASYVSTKKYGDCKALTVFMKAMLQSAGIPSFMVNVNGAANPETVYPVVPGPQFNHMILCIPIGRDTVWLENTANHLPFGYLGTFTQNRPALIIDGVNSRLTRTPALNDDQVLCQKKFEYQIGDDGSAQCKASWELRGSEFENYKQLHVNESQTKTKEAIEHDLPGRDYSLNTWSLTQPNRDTPFINLTLDLKVSNLLRSIGRTQVIRLIYFDLPELEAPVSRTSTAVINFPIEEKQELIFHLPEADDRVVVLPNNVSLSGEFGQYKIDFIQAGNTAKLQRYLSIHAGKVSPARYPDFYRFIQSIREVDRSSQILINPKP